MFIKKTHILSIIILSWNGEWKSAIDYTEICTCCRMEWNNADLSRVAKRSPTIERTLIYPNVHILCKSHNNHYVHNNITLKRHFMHDKFKLCTYQWRTYLCNVQHDQCEYRGHEQREIGMKGNASWEVGNHVHNITKTKGNQCVENSSQQRTLRYIVKLCVCTLFIP